MIWGILSLSRLQMILKWKDSLSGKGAFEGKAEDVAGQLFANISERWKALSIQSHKRLLEEI